MKLLESIYHAIISLVEQAWLLATSPATTLKQARRQIGVDECEVERLDRLRNPSKYVGK
jgi:hypothetical protein